MARTPDRIGTHDIQSLLDTTHQSIADFGMDTIQQVLADDVAAHNAIVADQMTMVDRTEDRLRLAGSSINGEFMEVDEYGAAPTQKEVPGSQVGFPLRKYQFAVGWTEDYMLRRTPADMALKVRQVEKADLRNISRELQRAVYLSANYTFTDHLVDEVPLPVKRFWNADGDPIPDGPNGEVFDGATHTHYNFAASLTDTAAYALIDDVVEHGFASGVKIVIHRQDEAKWRALPDFHPYVDARITQAVDRDRIENPNLDLSRLDNRPIGIFGAAEVWVKSWGIQNYSLCWAMGEAAKPLVWREEPVASYRGLRVAANTRRFPLEAEHMERRFGLGVWNRGNGAVLYHAGGAYTDPTI